MINIWRSYKSNAHFKSNVFNAPGVILSISVVEIVEEEQTFS